MSRRGLGPDVFCDTEFSQFAEPELISIALVAQDGQELYLETSSLPSNCSEFVKRQVLPNLQRGDVAVSPREMSSRVASWLRARGADIAVGCDSKYDWLFLQTLLEGTSVKVKEFQLRYLDPAQVSPRDLPVATKFQRILDEYHCVGNRPRHHALHDARAWKHAWDNFSESGEESALQCSQPVGKRR